MRFLFPRLLHKKNVEGNTGFPSTVDDNKYVVITTNFTLGVRIACDGRKLLAYGIIYNLQQSVTEFLYRVQLGGVFSYIVIDSQKFLLSALRNVSLQVTYVIIEGVDQIVNFHCRLDLVKNKSHAKIAAVVQRSVDYDLFKKVFSYKSLRKEKRGLFRYTSLSNSAKLFIGYFVLL